MLKTIEEPPERTLFIFLTEDKEDIIETIISRSQSFYVPSINTTSYNTDFLSDILADYPAMKKIDVLDTVQKLLTVISEQNLKLPYVLDCMEFYFAQIIKRNPDNKILIHKIKKDILNIQKAKKQTRAYIKPQLILDNLFFEFVKF